MLTKIGGVVVGLWVTAIIIALAAFILGIVIWSAAQIWQDIL